MRKSRFTDEQVVAILREADRDPMGTVAKRQWCQRADDLRVAQAVRHVPDRRCVGLKHLEAENARLKKLVAERDLEIEMMKEINAKNGERAGSPLPSWVCDGPGTSKSGLGRRQDWPLLAKLVAIGLTISGALSTS